MEYVFSKEEIIELETARRVNKDKRAEQRLHAVLLRAQGKACKEAAQAAGYKNWKSVSELVGKYKRNGIAAIAGNHYGGNRRNLSLEEERKFIDGFKAKAEKGELVTVKQIKIAYCKLIGHQCGRGQIYRVLERQQWRKVVPRKEHPNKASEEEIEA